MRGRLIQRFLAELHPLDTEATADPEFTGSTTGYDLDFKEPVLTPQAGQQVGTSTRAELPVVRIPCQVDPEAFGALQQMFSGNAPNTTVGLVMHFRDLERMGLIHSETGEAMVRIGDRLGAIYDTRGALVQTVRNPPGLFVTEAKPTGWGISMAAPTRNLLEVTFEDREKGARI